MLPAFVQREMAVVSEHHFTIGALELFWLGLLTSGNMVVIFHVDRVMVFVLIHLMFPAFV